MTLMENIIKLLLWFYLLSISKFSLAVDTIAANQSIRDGVTLVSAGENFELGFFRPGNSINRYLGIWYKKKATGTVVWVANREVSLHSPSGVLEFTNEGILVLLNSTGDIIWSANSSRSIHNPVAQLLDTGNLVVKDGNDDNPENFLWQSFDYPCDTLLAGMKFGFNKMTGLNRLLTSWKSNDDPSRGDIIYGLDPHGYPQLILKDGSTDRFRIGPWNGLDFSGHPLVMPGSIFKMNFVVNQEEAYYSYDLVNSSVISRVVLTQSGFEQRWTWIDRTQVWFLYMSGPIDNCDMYGLCGAYGICNMANSPPCGCLDKFVPRDAVNWNRSDWTNGCVRRTALDCNNGDGFLKYSGIKLPDTRISWFNDSMTLKECETVCLKNCSCMAYANLDIRREESSCLLWFGDLIDIRDSPQGGQDIYIRMASSEIVSQGDSNRKKWKMITISLTLSMGILLPSLLMIMSVRKKNTNRRHLKIEGRTKQSDKEEMELPLFALETIANATNDFSINNKLGEGGFGPVYKGMLEEGHEIAVKRLSKNSSQGSDEFKNEVIFIAKLQHRNLVKLLGCCIQGEENLLIYEYMPNKSLDSFIFDQTQSTLLDWPKRFHIINGVARGLLYLHQDSRLRIIHRDLKASNILLDRELNPKISDFGLARCFGENECEEITSRVVGTYGYMSPEYALHGHFSVKSDAFSFGVLVLEIVSGKKNRGFVHPDHHLNLLGHAWKLYKEGKSMELIDASLRISCYLSEVLRSIQVGLLCVQHIPEDRPNMSSVVMMLGSETTLPQPKQPGFYTERIILEADSPGKTLSCPSNEVTITELEGR